MTTSPAHEWTLAELDALPDDGVRYEVVDGVLLVSPAPVTRHQLVAAALYAVLRDACPADHRALFAPVDFRPTGRRSLQPDLLVVHRDAIGGANLTTAPLLAVEVLSPSTRSRDLTLKHDVYAESGVAGYWVVDPDEPSLVAYALQAGSYVEVARARGAEVARVPGPISARVVPADLLA